MLTPTGGSRWLRAAGFWLLAAALVLPAASGSLRSACCVMEAPCCPETVSDSAQPTLSGPVPGCCERVLATDRDAPADRRGFSAPPQWVAEIAIPESPAALPVVRTGIAVAQERCSDPPHSPQTGRSPPSSIA